MKNQFLDSKCPKNINSSHGKFTLCLGTFNGFLIFEPILPMCYNVFFKRKYRFLHMIY
jgi:hypothetical protein